MMSRLTTKFAPIIPLIFFIGIFGAGSIFLGQDVNWDLLQYHFYNGYSFLHHRSAIDIAPAMIQTFYNPIFDVINYLIISLQNPRLAEFLLGSFSGISCFFIYKITMLIFDTRSRLNYIYIAFAVIIGMTGAGSISLLNTTTNDTKMAMMCIISLYYAMKGLHKNSLKCILLSGLFSGIGLGLKLPAICYTIGLFIALAFSTHYSKKTVYTLGIFSASVLSGFILSNGYWMLTLYQKFQNPFFPLYNNYFRSDYAPYLSFNFYVAKQPLYLFNLILLPYFLAFKNTLTTEIIMRDLRLSVICSLMIIFIPYYLLTNKKAENKNNLPGFIFIFFIASYLVWIILFSLYRYFLPLEMISGILIVYFAQYYFTTHQNRIILLTVLISTLCFTTLYPAWGEKQSYGKHYFSFSNIPILPKNSTVFLTTVPLSYVIPFFSQDTRFVGLPFLMIKLKDINSSELSSKKYLMNVMQDKTLFPSGSTYTLSFDKPDSFDIKSEKILKYFGWKKGPKCELFSDNIGNHFRLCPLVT